MDTVAANAAEALRLHKTKRAGDLTERSRALEEIEEYVGLESAPLRIECYDISHTQGSHQVASMVVFEDGAPRKSAYRHFTIRGPAGEGASDDTAAMDEVLTRRFRRLLAEEAGESGYDEDGVALASGPLDPDTGRPRRFSYRPDLVVVDGGLPQVNAAAEALARLGIDVPVIGLAKRLEEVWIPGEEFPVIFPRTSSGLYLLQHVRDESHRFAITAHRKKRGRAMTRSLLDDIPGLGPAKQRSLLNAFGSLAKMREASEEDLAGVKGIGAKLASTIYEALHPGASYRLRAGGEPGTVDAWTPARHRRHPYPMGLPSSTRTLSCPIPFSPSFSLSRACPGRDGRERRRRSRISTGTSSITYLPTCSSPSPIS